ncbi:MAG: hypothetical protein JSR26_04025 [Proteobacteria bacterium]|nr:hypothetical protein [Pseudomonadota bacterium]
MSTIEPSLALLRRVRAAFILQGTSLKGWCREHDIHLSNARNCLIGSWNGPAGKTMRQRLIKASGLREAA